MIHSSRKLSEHPNAWVRQFACEDLKPLIICRGPIRKEAMTVFEEMGIDQYGILLSDKDSIMYAYAQAPELRTLTDDHRVHRVEDYSGSTKEDRKIRISQIIEITKEFGYNSIFAGYGFMSEDADMVRAMEHAGLCFIGPHSGTQSAAGLKDQAKRTALAVDVSVTPGIDDVTVRTLLNKAKDADVLSAIAQKFDLDVDLSSFQSKSNALSVDELHAMANMILEASYAKGVDLFSIEELIEGLRIAMTELYRNYPEYRIRLKAISGGGGKGQRILASAKSFKEYEGNLDQQIIMALKPLSSMAREVLAEVKCAGVGDRKNIIAELNIEQTRHQEIQVVGNGVWCITLGGRDCSLQMHEQKLLEVSMTVEELALEIDLQKTRVHQANTADEQQKHQAALATLELDLVTLKQMEEEAQRFGLAVGLNSLSTFECIVDQKQHFFMEMNTRIQVEHRVTELCYAVQFTQPNHPKACWTVTSLVELMVLLARHGKDLPCPTRIPRQVASVEARLNACNDALLPHAGGHIDEWSNPIAGEIRDDQGICVRNPDTDTFMRYHLAGAYDSNIALILTYGDHRAKAYQHMAEVLRVSKLKGEQFASNLAFHYGLLHWFISQNVHARPSTKMVVPYLTAVGALKQQVDQCDFTIALQSVLTHYDHYDVAIKQRIAQIIKSKHTLLLRPLKFLMKEAHVLAGWMSKIRNQFTIKQGTVEFLSNPLEILADLYHFLNLDQREARPALQQIWTHDAHMLQQGLEFYQDVQERLGIDQWQDLQACLAQDWSTWRSHSTATVHSTLALIDADMWHEIQASHWGHQLGLDLLKIMPLLAHRCEFFALQMCDDLSVHIPDRFMQSDFQKQMSYVLAPPPIAKSDELVAQSGGMFYPREAPNLPFLIEEGDHFEKGDPLYIIEVMKMFNKVYAPFSGRIVKRLVDGEGIIIKKGQAIFKVKPDLEMEEIDPQIQQAHRKIFTREIVQEVLSYSL